mgnify:CR=1 FL=1
MKFDPNDVQWTAYALGEGDPATRAEMDREVARNPEARAFVESIQGAATQVRAALAREPAMELRPEQRRAVRERAAAARPALHFPLRPLVALGLAAGIVAAIGVGLFRAKPPVTELSMADKKPDLNVTYTTDERMELDTLAELPAEQALVESVAPPREAEKEELSDLVVADASVPVDVGMNLARPKVAGESSPLVMKNLYAGRSRVSERQEVPSAPLASVAPAFARRNINGYMARGMVKSGEMPSEPRIISPSLDDYDVINENPFQRVADHPLSTFSIDVDSASYAVVRKYLLEGTLPPKDAVRIEELVNYFRYDYPQPVDGRPFAVHLAAAPAPWNPRHHLVRVALKAKEIDRRERPPVNLVFLIDVSGSMSDANKLPLVKRSLQALAKQLDERDRLAIVVYAGAAGLVLPTTSGERTPDILAALDGLNAGGSTAGGAGIQLAYDTARAQFATGGVNRVILCTDGDFNVGLTQRGDLERLIEDQAKSGVYLTVLGFGMGNYKDSTLELLSNKGNGNYGYIDDFSEARRLLVDEMLGTLVTVAKDVKIQVEFNPARVAGYRLIGYENRMLKKEDFNNDRVDAGDVGAGHTVTAFYEVVPAGQPVPGPGEVDALKYQRDVQADRPVSDDLLTAKLRYKLPDGDTSTKLEFPLAASSVRPLEASGDMRFATAVAGFGMILRESPNKGDLGFDDILKLAESDLGADVGGYRRDFLNLVRNAAALRK